MKSIKRLAIAAILAIALVLSIGAYAYFTDYAASSTSARAGTLDITLNGITQDLTNGLTIMNPGDSNDLSFTVTNTGEKSATVRAVITVTAKDKDGNAIELSDDHEYKITDLDGKELNGTFGEKAGEDSATAPEIDRSKIVYTTPDVTLNGSIETEPGITETSHTYNYQFAMDLEARNAWQGTQAAVQIEVFAKQDRNTDDVGDNWTDIVERDNVDVPPSEPTNPSTPDLPLAVFSITYETNGGILPEGAADEYIVGVPVTLLVPTREGYEFEGWYEDHYFQGEPVTSTDGRDGYRKVYYAKWTEIIVDEESGINYRAFTVTSENRSKVGYTGSADESLVIPATFQDTDGTWYKVTAIDGAAFYGCSNLNSITIPDTVTSIGGYAFAECTGLTSVSLPANLISIGQFAFEGCSGLTNLEIPDKVTSIGDYAFSACTGLASVVIPDSVISIGISGFYGCSSLTSIDWPNNLTVIGSNAFADCTGLNNLELPNGLTTIGDIAFINCTNLASVTIPSSVSSIGINAFIGCSGITDVYFEGTKEQWESAVLKGIGTGAGVVDAGVPSTATIHFLGEKPIEYVPFTVTRYNRGKVGYTGSAGENLVIPATFQDTDGTWYEVVAIGDYAFHLCSNLTSVTIPDTVTSIGNQSFYSTGLTSIVIPDAVTSIGSGAFEDCYGLRSITIPNGVITIGGSAFRDCSGLNSVTIPDSVTTIGGYAFYYSGITSIEMGTGITTIGDYAFYGCSGISDVYYGSTEAQWNAISIGTGNNYLHDATLHYWDGNKYIGYFTVTYSNREKVGYTGSAGENLVIPATFQDVDGTLYTVTAIGSSAFYKCSGLNSVTIPDSVTTIGGYAFDDCTGLTSVELGNGIHSLELHAFENCRSLTSVTIPDSITSIGQSVFYECFSLTDISVGSANRNYCSIDGVLYNKDVSKLIYCPTGRIGSIEIPDGITTICAEAFYFCDKLTSVTIPDSVTHIEDNAFQYCSALTSLNIGSGAISIGKYAFSNCTRITSVSIPNTVTTIAQNAFSSCIKLSDIYYMGTETQWTTLNVYVPNTVTIHYV